MTRSVLDSSALLAVVFDEPGGRIVEPLIDGAIVNAANLAEVIGKMIERGWGDTDISDTIKQFALDVVPLDRELAVETGFLRRATIGTGLSLGGRACIATAIREGAPACTADRAWSGIELGCKIELIR